jgi:lysophospholipase L1-like esterase
VGTASHSTERTAKGKRRWPWSVVGAVVAVVLLVASFEGGVWWKDHHPDPEPNPPPPETVLIQGARYVALGDSYSAGEGLIPYLAGTEDTPQGDRCHRSDYAFPEQLRVVTRDAQGAPTKVEPIFRPCSGANIVDIFDHVQTHSGVANVQGLQVKPGILGPDVGLVTLTIGGNDLDFAKALIFCAKRTSCLNDTYQDGKTLEAWAEARLDSLRQELLALFGRLRGGAPNAHIVVLGYPHLLPESRPSLLGRASFVCKTALEAFGRTERLGIRGITVAFDEMVESVAQEKGLDYVDLPTYFAGHEACGQAGQWIRFAGFDGPRDGWFHPSRTGQGMIARIVACYLSKTITAARDSNSPDTGFLMSSCVADRYPEA